MKRIYQVRRSVGAVLALVVIAATIFLNQDYWHPSVPSGGGQSEVVSVLNILAVKGRAPKTGYSRAQFGDGWQTVNGCDTRNKILFRDLTNTVTDSECNVTSGTLSDPYTGKTIEFKRGAGTSSTVQIDHVVALGDAWQKGAQQLSATERERLANDPLELIAVDGQANQQKSDGDAATWLPPNKPFRCQYVARQIAVKQKYRLWVTQAEKDAMNNVLATCPTQKMPTK
jgi:hypothetical protein